MGAVIALCSGALGGQAHAASGDLDLTFSGDGVATLPSGDAAALVVQPDGKIVVAGCTNICNGTFGDAGKFQIARFNPNGSLDTTFSGDGVTTTGFGTSAQAEAVALQPDGKIVVAGCKLCDWTSQSDFALARYNPNGALDTTFSGDGKVATDLLAGDAKSIDQAYGVAVQPDGKIVAGGFMNTSFAVMRYKPAGGRDSSFGANGLAKVRVGGRNSIGFDLALQPDGKVVLAGDVDGTDGAGDAGVARFGTAGQLDPGFGSGGTATLDFKASFRAVQSVALQPDGKVLVAGESDVVHSGKSTEDFALGRWTAGGLPDSPFGNGGRVFTDFGSASFQRDDVAEAVELQADGKILAAGHSFGGTGSSFQFNTVVARYLAGGGLDPTFGTGGRVFLTGSNRFNDLAVQADGRILVARQTFGVIRLLP